MLCEVCNANVATVHLTEIVNKSKKELHLCDACARDKGYSVKSHFSVSNLVAGLSIPSEKKGKAAAAEKPKKGAAREKAEPAGPVCPVCGLSYAEFRAKGRVGCAKDYEVFRDELIPLLERIHGQTQHAGKTPRHADEAQRKKRKVVALRQELNRAIQEEEYERAARLRDELYALEGEIDR